MEIYLYFGLFAISVKTKLGVFKGITEFGVLKRKLLKKQKENKFLPNFRLKK